MRTGARGGRFDLRVRGAGLRIWRGLRICGRNLLLNSVVDYWAKYGADKP